MKFRNGDTLFARITPCLENGKACFVQCLSDNTVGWGSTEFIVMRPKEVWPKEVAYLLSRNEQFRSFAIQGMTGTSGRQRVQASYLEEYGFAYSADAALLAILKEILGPLFSLIRANSLENENLAQLRDTLLPKLISGELSMKERRKAVAEIVSN